MLDRGAVFTNAHFIPCTSLPSNASA
jgi:hypothetical protein